MVANMGMSDRTKEVFTAGGHGYMIKVHKIKLRGRVKFSTGGKLREPTGGTGATPVATVKVWLEEVFVVDHGHPFLIALASSCSNVSGRVILGTFSLYDEKE